MKRDNYFDIIKPASEEWNYKFCLWLEKNYFNATMRILDLGCGAGHVVSCLTELGYDIDGYDYPEIDLEKKLPFNDNSYECVILKFVIEHINNIQQLMIEVHRILSPGGIVIILTDDYTKDIENFYDDPSHITPFTILRLKNLALLSGFNIIELRRWRNIPYIWRYTYKAFDYSFPFSKQLFGVFIKRKYEDNKESFWDKW
jgi:ubiquinone/menaquinone biosynthesis C-methylase UbiE